MNPSSDPLIRAIRALDPVPARDVPHVASLPGAVARREAIMARAPRRARRRRALPIAYLAAACLAALVLVPTIFGYSSAISAIADTLGFDAAPASEQLGPPAAPVTTTSTSSITPPTPAVLPAAVQRLVALMTDRPGGIPEDELPGAPTAGSVRLALADLGALHRQLWLSTTDKGAVCEIILTGDQGGGGCIAHFQTNMPFTTDVVGSDPADYSGDRGPAYLFGLATSAVTGIDVETPDGSLTPASFGGSAWYWETAPGPHALRGTILHVHLADGTTQVIAVSTAAGLRPSAF